MKRPIVTPIAKAFVWLTIVLLHTGIYTVKAQNASHYSFSAISGTFTSIVGQPGSVAVPAIYGDDMISNGILPFPFTFNYCGNSYNGIKVCSNGWVTFESNSASTSFNNSTSQLNFIKPALMPLWDNLTGATTLGATAVFQTSGTAPNRVFTFECNNWGWSNTATTGNISFQVKLFEGTDIIQFVYRPEAGSLTGSTTASIGICDGNTIPTYLSLNNSGTTPVASSTLFTTNINTRPASGQIFQFTPPPPCSALPPVALVSPAGVINTCVGNSITFSGTLSSGATGVTYQWESAPASTGPWTAISGATTTTVTVTPTLPTTYYRLTTICSASSQTNSSTAVVVNSTAPNYVSIPYFQDFETWVNYCATSDIPSGSNVHWKGNPATGNNAWRRNDQGSTAGWGYFGGSYTPSSKSGTRSARFSSGSVSNGGLPTNNSGNLDLHLDCSSISGNKQAYFYFINRVTNWFCNDSLKVYLSTDGGLNFNHISTFDSANVWKRVSVPIVSNSNQTILRFMGYVNANGDFSDIGIDSLYIASPCSGMPFAGTIASVGAGCPGSSYTLNVQGTTMGGNLSYVWQESTNGGLNWTVIPGATTTTYVTPTLYDSIRYRMVVTCGGSALSDTTNAIVLNIATHLFASVPYTESFESWMSSCSNSDRPSLNWANAPATGDPSWRRDDQGTTAWGFNYGDYSPASKHQSHSARFHSSITGGTGNLELFVDCSSPGTKELQFFYINPTSFADSLRILISADNGATFTRLAAYGSSATWSMQQVPITSASTQTIIRFQGVGEAMYVDDLGIDLVRVLPPCGGVPVAGTVDSFKVCSGRNFDLSLSGTSSSGGLTYTWQSSPDNITWTNLPGGNTAIVTTNITVPTYFRAIVTCANSSTSDTSVSQYFPIAPFYHCYCENAATVSTGGDIGNFSITRTSPIQIVLNNGNAAPLSNNANATNTYTDYSYLPAPTLNKNSTYNFKTTAITSDVGIFASPVSVYIDLNRDGIFSSTSERVVTGTINQISHIYGGSYKIPMTAQYGITGLRVVYDASLGTPDPCFQPYSGEVEDYLVIIGLPACSTAVNPGVATITDTLLCPTEVFSLIDTGYDKSIASYTRTWQSSTNNQTWTDIANSQDLDTFSLAAPNQSTYYRLKVICTSNNTASFSNAVLLKIRLPHFCYCPSYANGGSSGDLSDVGAFSIGTFVVNGGGPHLSNPAAVKSYTANNSIAQLYRDSSFNVSVYHIIKDANQQDAKVTLFIDFNNNLVYDIPSERVWTGYTDATHTFINTSIMVPASAVTNTYTGMRLILNNDVGPNAPSDDACGIYYSGETEDYGVIIFEKPSTTGVTEAASVAALSLYPNPSDGQVNCTMMAHSKVDAMHLIVTNIIGTRVYEKSFLQPSVGNEIKAILDLTAMPKGVYIVTLDAGSEKIVRKLVVQ